MKVTVEKEYIERLEAVAIESVRMFHYFKWHKPIKVAVKNLIEFIAEREGNHDLLDRV